MKRLVLGIDFGASTTDIVLLQGNRLLKVFSFERNKFNETSLNQLSAFLKGLNLPFSKISKIAVTGGKSKQLNGKKIFGIPIVHVSEIQAIGFGGSFVSKLKNCLVVSCGTGTCIVQLKNGIAKHFGGTGIGGGTILGLSQLLLKTKNLIELEKLASEGNLKNVDLSVKNVIGSGIGIVPANATASNFANLKNPSRNDLAFGIQNLVGEVVAVSAVFAAKACRQNMVVFVGKAVSFDKVKKAIQKVAKYYGVKVWFPKNGGIATAAGAAISCG